MVSAASYLHNYEGMRTATYVPIPKISNKFRDSHRLLDVRDAAETIEVEAATLSQISICTWNIFGLRVTFAASL
jgi:hypothetical protein